MKIIDALCYVPTEEVMVDLWVSLPPQMARYLRDIFGPGFAPLIGLQAEELYQKKITLSPKEMGEFIAPRIRPLCMSEEEFIVQLDQMEVEKAVIFNLDEETPSGLAGLPNDYYADIVRRHPERFVGFAGIDPLKGMDAVREIRRAYDLGLRGVAMRPFMFGLAPNHAKYYPIYSTCVELDIPIWFHLSVNYSTQTMEVERPIYLDVVAQDFPELKMIAGHGGWPWINEMVAVAWRNPNIYIDIASYHPRHFTIPGSGWEMLLHFGNTVLQDRILFGSTWAFMGRSIRDLADEVMELPLKEEVKAKWLYHNARRLLGIE
ncbi:MAG: amidohydrolase family protein [Proteobacteria bacterium]|nr:amidohydrolase family protein [Pseudomonadota bacterium]